MKRTLKTRTLCLLPALLMAAALLPGCQPTPEEEFVVNRLDGALEEAVLATPAPPAQYEAPERWTESFDVRGQTVRIDVAVEVPDAVEYPVLTVQNAPFTAHETALCHTGMRSAILPLPLTLIVAFPLNGISDCTDNSHPQADMREEMY